MIHGLLPDSMQSDLLVPVQNLEWYSLDNYRPVALARFLFEILENILPDRINVFINSANWC